MESQTNLRNPKWFSHQVYNVICDLKVSVDLKVPTWDLQGKRIESSKICATTDRSIYFPWARREKWTLTDYVYTIQQTEIVCFHCIPFLQTF